MAISLIATGSIFNGQFGGTTAGINASGANLGVAFIGTYDAGGAGGVSVTDSNGNTWTQRLQVQSSFAVFGIYIFDCVAGTFTNGMTLTTSVSGSNYPTIIASFYSGIDTSSPRDGLTGQAAGDGSTTISTGSITTTHAGDLILAAVKQGDGATSTPTVDSSLTIEATDNSGYHMSVADLIQSAAGAINPTWSGLNGTNAPLAAIIAYKAAAGGGTVTTSLSSAAGVGVAAGFTSGASLALPPATGAASIGGFLPSVKPGTLSPAAGIGTASAFTPSLAVSLSAATALGQVAAFVPKDAVSLSSAAAVGTVGILNTPGGLTLPTAIGLGTAGGFTPSELIALAAAVATGTAAGLTAALSSALAAATASGNVASFVPSVGFTLQAANGTGVAGSFGKTDSIAFAPVVGVGAVGLLATPGNAGLSPAIGQGAAGGFVPSVFITLPPAQGIGAVATMTPADVRALASAIASGVASRFLGASFFLPPAIGVGSVAALIARILNQTLRFTAIACPASFTVVAENTNYTSVAPGDANVM